MEKSKIPIPYLLYILFILIIWGSYIVHIPLLAIAKEQIWVLVTMFFGAFIAGSSPEGSAAIAFPIFTLYLDIAPSVARNFAFAIQSVGMTAASIFIISRGIKIERNYIKFVSIGGLAGLVFGTYFIIPLVSPPLAKLLFVSLWLAFGIVLFLQNRNKKRIIYESLGDLQNKDILLLLIFGFIGGIISSIFGTGINIFTFCLMVTYYHMNEKVATSSSIIIMTIETIAGFLIHRTLLTDFDNQAFEMWIVCIPMVIFMAPLGTYVLSKITRVQLSNLLYAILVVQFIGAFLVIRPGIYLSLICLLVVLAGVLMFRFIATLKPIR